MSATDYKQDMVQGIGDDGRFGKNPAKMPGYNHLSGDVGDEIDKSQPYPFQKHGGYFNKDVRHSTISLGSSRAEVRSEAPARRSARGCSSSGVRLVRTVRRRKRNESGTEGKPGAGLIS